MKGLLAAEECPTADDEVIDYLNREMSENKKQADTAFKHGDIDIPLSDLMERLAHPEGLVGRDDCKNEHQCGYCCKIESGVNCVWCKSCKTLYCSRECALADWKKQTNSHKSLCKWIKLWKATLQREKEEPKQEENVVEASDACSFFSPFPPDHCANPHCSNTVGLGVCSKCNRVKYCSKDCQRSHWKTHRDYCKRSCDW